MNFGYLKPTVVVSRAAVFLLAAVHGMGMTWGLPASGPGSYSDRTATEAQAVSAAAPIGDAAPVNPAIGDQACSPEPCRRDERVAERITSSTASVPPALQVFPMGRFLRPTSPRSV